MEPGGLWWTNVLNLALPPERHMPDTKLEHQYPVSHMAQKKRVKRRKKEGGGRKEGRQKGGKKGRKEGNKKK